MILCDKVGDKITEYPESKVEQNILNIRMFH